jgi:hypothetical protein
MASIQGVQYPESSVQDLVICKIKVILSRKEGKEGRERKKKKSSKINL